MSPKHHHMPLSGGDRKALTKELSKSRAMTRIFAERSAVNAGEILQRLAGVKVQHGRSKKAPDIGGLLACRFSFLRGVVQRWV